MLTSWKLQLRPTITKSLDMLLHHTLYSAGIFTGILTFIPSENPLHSTTGFPLGILVEPHWDSTAIPNGIPINGIKLNSSGGIPVGLQLIVSLGMLQY